MTKVLSVSKSNRHDFSKETSAFIKLAKGLGVIGDTHLGVTVQHRSRLKKDPTLPNLRQVHLIHNELIIELQAKGFKVSPASMGENITTQGINLLNLATNTVLKIGLDAEIKITGLRNPCAQLDAFQQGLTAAVLDKNANGKVIRKAGVMGIVIKSGIIKEGDTIQVTLPSLPHSL